MSLTSMEPVPTLLERIHAELGADFDFTRPIRVSRAPGRLDVMGGIADYTGSLVCEATLDRAAAVALQARSDRQVQVFSFNLFDQHLPFTFRMPLDGLISQPIEKLAKDFSEPNREWAAYIVGCLFVLNEINRIHLKDPLVRGLNIALYSTVPIGAGVSSSAAIEVATMMNLLDHFGLRESFSPLEVAVMCQRVENHLAGAACGIMDQVAACVGEAGSLMRMLCQPHELQEPLHLPAGVRVVGINSNVKHSVGGGQYGITRCAAFMAHSIILATIRQAGAAAGRELTGDPTHGYLASINPDDYRQLFRPHLPEYMDGREFLDRFGPTIDTATTVDPTQRYPIQHAADHHVLEARRVKQFVAFLSAAVTADPRQRSKLLDKAGHLMYASHLSYSNDAMLGADECDTLVNLVRGNEKAGLYGARITGGGSGGTVAILTEQSQIADEALRQIVLEYNARTGRSAELLSGTSPGAWHVGTQIVGG